MPRITCTAPFGPIVQIFRFTALACLRMLRAAERESVRWRDAATARNEATVHNEIQKQSDGFPHETFIFQDGWISKFKRN